MIRVEVAGATRAAGTPVSGLFVVRQLSKADRQGPRAGPQQMKVAPSSVGLQLWRCRGFFAMNIFVTYGGVIDFGPTHATVPLISCFRSHSTGRSGTSGLGRKMGRQACLMWRLGLTRPRLLRALSRCRGLYALFYRVQRIPWLSLCKPVRQRQAMWEPNQLTASST